MFFVFLVLHYLPLNLREHCSDGTQPSGDTEPMSKDGVNFLEKVMQEGIIDEGKRIKSILKDLTDSLEMMLGVGHEFYLWQREYDVQ